MSDRTVKSEKPGRYAILNLVTLGPLGYWPAPGTCGTLAAVPVVSLVRIYLANDVWYLVLCLALLISANWLLQRAYRLDSFMMTDAPEIIIDEWVGFFWSSLLVPATLLKLPGGIDANLLSWGTYWGLSFLLFRALDILKPWPIYCLERLPGSWGVLLDDVGAAVFTNLCLLLGASLL